MKLGRNKHYVMFYVFIIIYFLLIYKLKQVFEMLKLGTEFICLISGIPFILGGVWGNKVGLILIPTQGWMPFKSVKSLNKFYIVLGIIFIVLFILGQVTGNASL